MIQLIASSAILSVLHSILPNHWLPVLAVGKKKMWSLGRVTFVTLMAGLAHALSTVFIGIAISLFGIRFASQVEHFTPWIAPSILIALGIYFVWRHHRHHHFHLHQADRRTDISSTRIITFLVIAMFFSPCLEFTALYLLAWNMGWSSVLVISLIYVFVSVTGMVLWVWLAYRGLRATNWHMLEHNTGLISGVVLILTGVLFFFIQ